MIQLAMTSISASPGIRPYGRPGDTGLEKTRLLLAILACFPAIVLAGPADGSVSLGSATIGQNGAATVISQYSDKVAIDWRGFSIDAGESVRFVQPSAASIALNRVTGGAPSTILGSLSANGQVFLVNPQGILFGKTAQVDVAALVAGTLNLSDADLAAGNLRFGHGVLSDAGAGVTNRGRLSARDGGTIALLAPRVINEGVIDARLGSVVMVAGDEVTLSMDGAGLLGYAVGRGAFDSLAENRQLIVADGGQVLMSAVAADAVSGGVVNNSGAIQARRLDDTGGVIRLIGDMQSGRMNLSGSLDASAQSLATVLSTAASPATPWQSTASTAGAAQAGSGTGAALSGGFVETSAASVKVADSARVTTAGAGGGKTGSWLVDPTDFTIAAVGGDITPTALAARLADNNITLVSTAGLTAGHGDLFVQDAVSWNGATTLTLNAIRHVNVNAPIVNTGGGSLLLRADLDGAGIGTVNIDGAGSVSMSGGGRTDLYYNPLAYAAPTDFTGKIAGPYTAWMLVNDLAQLQSLAGAPTGSYALGRNIDASATSAWNGGAGFEPIYLWRGAFDGLGHGIANLFINRSNGGIGLFANNEGTISRVDIVGGSVTGGDTVGAIAGSNRGLIEFVNASAAVQAHNTAGGVVGRNDGTVNNSSASGTVSGTTSLGGLIGTNNRFVNNSRASGDVTVGGGVSGGLIGLSVGGAVVSSSAAGKVTADNTVGGLIGENNNTTVSGSSASGEVTAVNDVAGGLIGNNRDSASVVTGSSATGAVSGSRDHIGGLIGKNRAAVTDSWASGNVSAGAGIAGGLIGSNVGGAISGAHATGVVWGLKMVGGLVGSNAEGRIMNSWAGGAVTATENMAGGLVGVNTYNSPITGSHALGAASAGTDGAGGLVGTNSSSAITDSYARGNARARSDAGGLVGDNNSSAITGASASGDVSGQDTAGGLIGSNNNSFLTNVAASGDVEVTVNLAGGLVARNFGNSVVDHATASGAVRGAAGGFGSTFGGLIASNDVSNIANASASGDVEGGYTVGGLIGQNTGSDIVASHASGNVIANADNAGGLVGIHGGGAISLSYATGNVQAYNDAGGLIGSNAGSAADVYASGNVRATNSTAGGLAGTNTGTLARAFAGGTVAAPTQAGGIAGNNGGNGGNGGGILQATYWNAEASGVSAGVGPESTAGVAGAANAATGLSGAQMLQAASFTGLDLTGTWRIYEGRTTPLLKTFLTALTVSADDITRTYDGSLSNALQNVVYSDAGAPASGHLFGSTGAYGNARNAGTYLANNALWSDQAGYDIQFSGGTLTIEKAALSISATASSKVYDGGTAATVLLTDNRVGGDRLTLSHTGAGFDSKDAGSGKLVTIAGITLGGADAGNYTVAAGATASADITPASLTLAGAIANDKVYDGDTVATLTGAGLAGLIAGDDVVLAGARFADKNTGAGKAVSVLLEGADLANYAFVEPDLRASILAVPEAVTPVAPPVVPPVVSPVAPAPVTPAVITPVAPMPAEVPPPVAPPVAGPAVDPVIDPVTTPDPAPPPAWQAWPSAPMRAAMVAAESVSARPSLPAAPAVAPAGPETQVTRPLAPACRAVSAPAAAIAVNLPESGSETTVLTGASTSSCLP